MENIIPRRTELEELRYQAGQITDDSLESTRRMLNMMEESEEAGNRTTEALAIQREQLKNVEQGMDSINADVSQAEKSLSRLKRCCNVCGTPWKKVLTQDESQLEYTNETEKNFKVIEDQPQRNNGKKMSGSCTSGGFITRITNDAREDEMESNLCQVNSMLGNLRSLAVDMTSELDQQNEQIDRINRKGNANAIRLGQVNTSASNLLNA